MFVPTNIWRRMLGITNIKYLLLLSDFN